MAQTLEERKIKRLEAQIKVLKEKVEEQEMLLKRKDNELSSERKWRMDFQALMKAAVHEDNLTDYERQYWS